MLVLTLGVNGAIETNVFVSSLNPSVYARVNPDARCEWAFISLVAQRYRETDTFRNRI